MHCLQSWYLRTLVSDFYLLCMRVMISDNKSLKTRDIIVCPIQYIIHYMGENIKPLAVCTRARASPHLGRGFGAEYFENGLR